MSSTKLNELKLEAIKALTAYAAERIRSETEELEFKELPKDFQTPKFSDFERAINWLLHLKPDQSITITRIENGKVFIGEPLDFGEFKFNPKDSDEQDLVDKIHSIKEGFRTNERVKLFRFAQQSKSQDSSDFESDSISRLPINSKPDIAEMNDSPLMLSDISAVKNENPHKRIRIPTAQGEAGDSFFFDPMNQSSSVWSLVRVRLPGEPTPVSKSLSGNPSQMKLLLAAEFQKLTSIFKKVDILWVLSRLSGAIGISLLYSNKRNTEQTPLNFHTVCDDAANTLVIARFENIIVGGYSDRSWCCNKHKRSTKSFLFTLKPNTVFSIHDCKHAIRCSPDYGPWFGSKIISK